MRILLCDDDKLFLESLKERLKEIFVKYGSSCQVSVWESGTSLLKEVDFNQVDILFLDIDMPEISGIQVAEKVKKWNPDINLVFLTNREDLVFKAIQFQPYRFIRKEKLVEELEETVHRLIIKIADETILYQFARGGNAVKVPIREIIYLESQGHNIQIHCRNQMHMIRGKLSEYDDRLEKYGFIRIHSGFLVNIRYIYTISYQGICLDNGQKLPVSRKKLDEIKKIHMAYMRKHIYGEY
ncbi:MAG: response regulator transcription factor [Lachnospiraceae bacterium]|nr:response regulator transcription factor [Lachnospiraceae bacterium]